MKPFEEMSPQRQSAHELFDQLLDLRVGLIQRLVAPNFTPQELLVYDEAMREHEALVDGAKEIVCISEVVNAAVPLQHVQTSPEPAREVQRRWPPQPK